MTISTNIRANRKIKCLRLVVVWIFLTQALYDYFFKQPILKFYYK